MIDIASNPIIPHMFRDGVAADRMRPRSVSYLPGRIREIRDSDRCGTPVLLDRPRTRHDAERLRLLYRRIGRDCMRTTSSARTGILGLPHYVDGGRPAYVVTGIVSDVHFDRDGRLVVADPAMIHGHAGLGDDLLTVSLGDRITFHCYLNAYRKGARKRIGIDEWFPIDSQLYYADRNGTRRRVPNHIRDGLGDHGRAAMPRSRMRERTGLGVPAARRPQPSPRTGGRLLRIRLRQNAHAAHHGPAIRRIGRAGHDDGHHRKGHDTTMDAINPDYYRPDGLGFECIDLTERYPFNAGNAIKYMFRLDGKDTPARNVRKAQWYARRAQRRGERFQPIRREDMDGAALMLRILADHDHQHAAPFWRAMLACLTGDADGDGVAAALDAMADRVGADDDMNEQKEEGR